MHNGEFELYILGKIVFDYKKFLLSLMGQFPEREETRSHSPAMSFSLWRNLGETLKYVK